MDTETILTKNKLNSILSKNKSVVVYFGSSWCGPCKTLSPIINEIKNENQDTHIIKLDVDSNSELSIEFGIKSIPALLFFKNGEMIEKNVGATSKTAIQEKINSII